MIPVWSFLVLVSGWLAFRALLKLEHVLVADRSPGFQALVAIGGAAFGLPALVEGHLAAALLVLLAGYSAWGLVDIGPTAARLRAMWRVRRRPSLDNVVPIRPS
jgi:hypothetical protein